MGGPKFALDWNGTDAGSLVGLGGSVFSVSGNRLLMDFGAQGIGGNRNSNAGDGYYEIALDLDDNGTYETRRHFYRLFGDVNGDRQVTSLDCDAIMAAFGWTGLSLEQDVNGDGVVNSLDKTYATRGLGRRLAANVLLDD